MKISSIEVYQFNIPFLSPIKVPIGTLECAENVLVKINTDKGLYGMGEASPFAPITGDNQASCFETGQILARLIKGKNPLNIEGLMNEINRAMVGGPSIRSAFDMALYDLLGKYLNQPLYRIFGGSNHELHTDLTVGLQNTVGDTQKFANDILEMGFDAIKLKVGRPGLEDVKHVAAVREMAGPDTQIRIDSNQGWDFPEAVAALAAMEEFRIQYSEQPIAAWDYENLGRLRNKARQPICADESVFDHHDAFKLTAAGAVDYLNIKLGKSGGLHTALKIDAVAQAAGCKCMIGCFGESRLGLSAAAHLAAARSNIIFLDLDSALCLRTDPVIGGMAYELKENGRIILTDAPGLGADLDPEFLKTCRRVTV